MSENRLVTMNRRALKASLFGNKIKSGNFKRAKLQQHKATANNSRLLLIDSKRPTAKTFSPMPASFFVSPPRDTSWMQDWNAPC